MWGQVGELEADQKGQLDLRPEDFCLPATYWIPIAGVRNGSSLLAASNVRQCSV